MRVAVATPVRPGTTSGNSVTAERWARRLTELGHDVTVVSVDPAALSTVTGPSAPDGFRSADLLVALHARRCAGVVAWWHTAYPDRPLVVGLTGTDLYHDLPDDADALASLHAATRLVVLQPRGIDLLRSFDPVFAAKTTVVHQSAEPPLRARAQSAEHLRIVVLAHLREVKDPFLTARAARLLPAGSRVTVDHAGAAHDDSWHEAAAREMAENPRYHWHGELARPDAMTLLARADLLACTSLLEGGANVVTEAISVGVPVVGTYIDGNLGLLGDDYPGLVPVGDAEALAHLLDRIERHPDELADLQSRIDARRHLTEPTNERHAWQEVLAALP